MRERKNFILTLLGVGISKLGTNLYTFAISFYILSVTGSPTSFALSLIVTTLPSVILSPIAGNLIDRLNKKYIVVGADVLSGIFMLGLYFLTAINELSLLMIYSASFILSVLFVFLSTAYIASYPQIVSDEKLVKINSYIQSSNALLQILAPVLGGIIYALIDIRVFILMNGLSFLVSALSEVFIDFTFNQKHQTVWEEKKSFGRDFVEGFEYLKSQKLFVSLAVYVLFINFFLSAFSVIMPYILVEIHGFNSGVLGVIEATFPAGAFISSFIIGWKNIVYSKKLFSRGMVFFALLFSLFTVPSLPFISLEVYAAIFYGSIFFLIAINTMMINVPLQVKFQQSIDEVYRGRVLGFLCAMSDGVMPVSYILTATLLTFLPSYAILLLCSLCLVGIALHISKNNALVVKGAEKVAVAHI